MPRRVEIAEENEADEVQHEVDFCAKAVLGSLVIMLALFFAFLWLMR